MNIPPGVSDEATDALVALAFLALPSMEADELAKLLEAVLRVVAREVRRVVVAERESWIERARASWRN